MAGVADQDHFAALRCIAATFDMNLGDERAGRIDNLKVARFGVGLDRLADAVRAEDRDPAFGHFVELLDERPRLSRAANRPRAGYARSHADIDGRPIGLQRLFHNVDCSLHPGAESRVAVPRLPS
jgi:hypothetical protein